MAEPALRPAVAGTAFEPLDELLRPFVEDADVRKQRRREAVAQLLEQYESEHGVISDEELQALDAEWLT